MWLSWPQGGQDSGTAARRRSPATRRVRPFGLDFEGELNRAARRNGRTITHRMR